MARKGNQQKNGTAVPNKKGKGNVNNIKFEKEELSSDTQPNISATEPLHKSHSVKDEKKRTNKSAKRNKDVKDEIQNTFSAEQSEPLDEDFSANTSTTGNSCLEEEKQASNNNIHKSKNRKRNSAHFTNRFDENSLPESVRNLKTFISSVSQASITWLERHKPLVDILITKTLISRDYVRMKVKYAYPIVMKWLTHLTNILLVLLMVWLDCTLRGIDSVIRMGTTSFFAVVWFSIFSVVAMMGMLKFSIVVAVVALVALFIGFTIGLLLLVISGIVFLWMYGSFWTTLTVLTVCGIAFLFSRERFALLIMTIYSVYSAWILVGWLGIIISLNLSFFSSDLLIFFLRNTMNEQRRNNIGPEQTSGPGVFTDGGGTGSHHPPDDRGSGVPSTSGSDSELTSEDEIVRLLNSVDHYSSLGLSRFQEIDVTFLKREYRKKAMLVHPDKNMGNEKAVEAFKKLQNAYEVLLDTSKQKTYDDELRREELLNYFRRFQNATPKNKRNGRTEVHVDDPLGESRRIACQKCGSFHMWYYTKKTKSRARSCQDCKDFHPVKDGDGWVEQSSQPLLFGIFQKVDTPHAYVCADSKIYDATEWYLCQGMRCPANTHKPSFHVNTSVISKHSNSKGPNSNSNSNPRMPNMDETMSEEEFMEWLQNAVESGMFTANEDNDIPASKQGGSATSSKRKKKGKKW